MECEGAAGREFRTVREAAAKVLAAERYCLRGQFAQAEEELRAALLLRPGWQVLEEIRRAGVSRADTRQLVERLHAVLAAENWTLALAQAEAIPELCPEYPPALDARRCVGRGGTPN